MSIGMNVRVGQPLYENAWNPFTRRALGLIAGLILGLGLLVGGLAFPRDDVGERAEAREVAPAQATVSSPVRFSPHDDTWALFRDAAEITLNLLVASKDPNIAASPITAAEQLTGCDAVDGGSVTTTNAKERRRHRTASARFDRAEERKGMDYVTHAHVKLGRSVAIHLMLGWDCR
jgi:hypothetical protein